MNNPRRFLCLFSMTLVCGSLLVAQVSQLVSSVNVPQAMEKQSLALSAELSKSSGVSRVILHYRSYGTSDYKEVEMLLAGRTATASFPAEAVLAPYVEYYLEVRLDDGTTETYPLQNPEANPQRVAVKVPDPKDQEVLVLSPEPGETVDIEELVVAISFFYASDNVNRQATKIYLDGTDVTAAAVFSDDVMLYSPKSSGQPLGLGAHRLRIELYDTQGNQYHAAESGFNVSTRVAIEAEKARVQAVLDGQAEYRNEELRSVGASTTYVRGDLRLNGSYGIMNFGASTHLDNQDKPERQPQNRFSFYGATSFLGLQIGDAYPKFPSYIVSGKRVRGLSANLKLGFFNVDVTTGQTDRLVEGTLDSTHTYSDSSSAAARPPNTVQEQGLRYAFFSPGTFQRDFFAVRPSFGKGENFQLGFTYMKAKDDVGSIKYGTSPAENLVVGSDLMFAFDDQRLKFESQASISITNTDISPQAGSFEDLKTSDPDTYNDLKDLADLASTFITINKNLFPTNPFGDGLPGVSYEAALTLNYFNNFIRGSLFKRGAGYFSFGNDFLQTDIEGFNISDRIRMFDNKAILSLAYEQRNDNTANNKAGTTDFNYFNSTLTVIPGANIPTFTVGYGLNNLVSDNQISRADLATSRTGLTQADSAARSNAIDNASNQLFLGASYDFVAGARQSLVFSLSSTSREDKSFFKRDQTNVNMQISLSTSFSPMLQTTVGYVLSQNESKNQIFTSTGRDSVLQTTTFDYSAATVSAQLRLFDESLRVLAALSPTFGAIDRTIVRAGLDYAVTSRHRLEFTFDYIQNSGAEDDTIGSLIFRFSF